MKESMKHIYFDLYLISIGLLSFFSYLGYLGDSLFYILMAITLVLVIGKANVLYMIPSAMFLQIGYADLRDNVQVTTVYSIVFVVIIVIDIIKNRKFQRLGLLFYPLLVLSVASVLTYFNAPDTFTWFAGLSQIASIFLLYVYYVNTLEKSDDLLKNVSKIFMYLGLFISLEMFVVLQQSDYDYLFVISHRMIDLGWENINIVIYNNILSIPLIAYLIMQYRVKLPYMIIAVINVLGIVLTLSRSSILTVGVYVIVLVPFMLIKKQKSRFSLVIQGQVLLLLFAIVMYYLEQGAYISGYLDSLFSRELLYYNDRMKLLVVAWDTFKEYPLFGSGGLYSSRYYLSDFGALNYHNTFAQVSTLGVLGILGLLYLFVEKAKLLIKNRQSFAYYLGVIIFCTTFVNGSLQPMYFYTSFMASLFLIIAAYEITVKQ
jgi:hypothetical protein